ncbi:hypothetical protein G6F35_011261 [Rhizopus arrhizus]|nr:hypothetical protein G6F35_011261 [Rhizopus arrhizus]
MNVEIPAERQAQAKRAAEVVDTEIFEKFPMVDGLRPMNEDLTELVLNRTWRPALSVTGVGGMPALESAGNVLRPQTSVKLSLRLPPTADGKTCGELLKEALLRDPPNGAHVTLDLEKASTGWNAPAMAPWLTQAIDDASQAFFGKPAMYMGEGGSSPFMGMLGGQFPGFPRAGQFPQRLESAGIALESVTDVIITHMHMDHVGGLLVAGVKERLRPDVRIHVSATEVAFWTSPDFTHTVMPKPVPDVLRSTATAFYNEYRDRLVIFEDTHEVAPGRGRPGVRRRAPDRCEIG